MGDLQAAMNAARKTEPGVPGRACSVALALEQLGDDPDVEAFDEAIKAHTMTAPQVVAVFEAMGVTPPPDGQVGRHRRGVCRCKHD